MQLGIFSVGDVHPAPVSGEVPTERERIHNMVAQAVAVEAAGLDVFAIGEHHNPPFVTSADSTLMAYMAARTERIVLSTSTTLITTNDPVKIAEDFATLQHLSDGRVDIMLGRGNTVPVYGWFGKELSDSLSLAVENYALLRRLWREENVDWTGNHRTPLEGFTAVPRPLNGTPPFVWHGSIRTPQIAEHAAYYGDGFFANNLFIPVEHFTSLVHYFRTRYEAHGHGPAATAPVGAGGQIYVARRSQDAVREFRTIYENYLPMYRQAPLEDLMATTGLLVGSPAQIVERALSFHEEFGSLSRQLFLVDHGGMPQHTVLEQIELIGSEIAPALREGAARLAPAADGEDEAAPVEGVAGVGAAGGEGRA